jgi:sugar phosphate isomerase/epimerase
MRLSLCNEVIREMDFAAQCVFTAAVGYDGLEVAPFTLDDEPHLLSADRRVEIRRAHADAGIECSSLHWLLVTPQGLSITNPDEAVRARTVDVMRRLSLSRPRACRSPTPTRPCARAPSTSCAG